MIMKRKLRYVLIESSRHFDAADRAAASGLDRALLNFMGEHNYADANFRVVTTCGDNSFIASVNRGNERAVVLALSFIRRVGDEPIGFYTLRMSGTMRKLMTEYRKLHAG